MAPRTEIQTRSIPSPYAPALTMLATSAPLILLLGWLAWRWGHRLLWLTPGAVSPDVSLSRLRLPPSITRTLFTSIGFRAAAQDLRRHRPVISADLDVDRSTMRRSRTPASSPPSPDSGRSCPNMSS